ncbi:glutamate dehydrogenase, partial [Candidatus Kaiserbacteria bacterium CG10_big_fil_rev_8_21_14_0_10_44_10]
HWSEEVVLERLRETLVPQASTIYKNAEDSGVTMRVAAFRLALERLETSLKSLR